MIEMPDKVLLVKSPYASYIVKGIKTKMRSRRTNIRGRIAIAESGTGTIIGEVDLVDCLGDIDFETAGSTYSMHRIKNVSILKKWRYPWVVANAKEYDKPIAYEHPKGAVTWVNLR